MIFSGTPNAVSLLLPKNRGAVSLNAGSFGVVPSLGTASDAPDLFRASGHTASNAPDLFRPPKLSGAGPG